MKLTDVLDVYSIRNAEQLNSGATLYKYSVPNSLRVKILLLCERASIYNLYNSLGLNYGSGFWEEIYETLRMRHGRYQLTPVKQQLNSMADTNQFLQSCADDEFLDFLEYIFRTEYITSIAQDPNDFVGDLNRLFASESVGYELTAFVSREISTSVDSGHFAGPVQTQTEVLARPQVIKKDDQITIAEIITPALQLLADPKYKSANQEFLAALDDYRKGDYGDCLAKCGSAFESVMKVICDSNKWPYDLGDPASKLLPKVVDGYGLDSFFVQPLSLIATMRNKLSTAHGAGVQSKAVSANLARYALNSTASAIVLLANMEVPSVKS